MKFIKYLKKLILRKNVFKDINIGDLIWAKRYNTKDEMLEIEEGHREGPYLVISKNNINEINNNDLLYYLIKLTESQSQFGKVDNVPINIVEDIHKESLFKNIKFNHDNINLDNKLLWVYNKDLNIYVKNNVTKDENIIPIFIKLDNVKKENNSYILSYKYGLKSISDNKIYGSYNNLINKVNPLQVDNSSNKEVLKQQLNNDYNNIKDKLSTYNYIVEVNDNNYILKDFNNNK